MDTFTKTITFEVYECCNCGMSIALTEDFVKRRRRDHEWWYCPNGHPQHWSQQSDIQKARKERDRANTRAEESEKDYRRERGERKAAERREAAQKGAKTRIKNRIAKGICPCCNRQFKNLHRHMTNQHPEYTDGEE